MRVRGPAEKLIAETCARAGHHLRATYPFTPTAAPRSTSKLVAPLLADLALPVRFLAARIQRQA